MGSEVRYPAQSIMPVAIKHWSRQKNVRDDEVAQLTRIWQELLNVEVIRPEENYFDLGGDSSLAVRMFSQIEDVFKIKLPLATLFEAPTIAQLAGVLDRQAASPAWSSIVPIQPSGSRPPFFCIHGAGGNVLIYRDLSKNLGAEQPFFGLQSQGLDGVSQPLTTIEEMASLYVKEIRSISPHGPYFLGGYCMGGTVAFEVAQQLQKAEEKVALLALFDTMNWSKVEPASIIGRSYHIVQRFVFHISNFFCLDFAGKVKFFREKVEDLGERLPIWMGMLLAKLEPNKFQKTMPESRALGRLWKANDKASLAYVPRPFVGSVTDFRPRKQYRQFSKPEVKWGSLALGGQTIVELPVYPAGMLVEPFVKYLATALNDAIQKAMNECGLA